MDAHTSGSSSTSSIRQSLLYAGGRGHVEEMTPMGTTNTANAFAAWLPRVH